MVSKKVKVVNPSTSPALAGRAFASRDEILRAGLDWSAGEKHIVAKKAC